MTEEEARAIIKAHGWFYTERSPKRVAKYIYAKRRRGKKMIQRYICPLSKLPELSKEQLVEILARPIEEPSSAEHEPEVTDTTDPLTHTDEL